MKHTLTVLLCFAALSAGCSSARTGSGHRRSLFARKVAPHSSPEALMTAYKKYATAGQTEKLWSLYSPDLQKKSPNGLFALQDKLRREPVSDIHIGNPIIVSDSSVLYFNIVTLNRGESILERAALIKENGKWFIESLGSDSQ